MTKRSRSKPQPTRATDVFVERYGRPISQLTSEERSELFLDKARQYPWVEFAKSTTAQGAVEGDDGFDYLIAALESGKKARKARAIGRPVGALSNKERGVMFASQVQAFVERRRDERMRRHEPPLSTVHYAVEILQQFSLDENRKHHERAFVRKNKAGDAYAKRYVEDAVRDALKILRKRFSV